MLFSFAAPYLLPFRHWLAPVQPRQVAFSEFVSELRSGRLSEVEIRATRFVGLLKPSGTDRGRPAVIIATRLPGIDELYERVRSILERRRENLDRVVRRLMEKETLDEKELRELLTPAQTQFSEARPAEVPVHG